MVVGCVFFEVRTESWFPYGWVLLVSHLTLKLEDHPLSAARGYLRNVSAATRHIWKNSPPSAT
jgi:hypothetical protein